MPKLTEERAARENINWFEQQLLISTDDREKRLLRDLLRGEKEKLAAASC